MDCTKVPFIPYNRHIPQKEFFMYTTKQFDKDVEELRRLIKMCDELIERQDRHTETLIQQFNGGK